MPAACWRFVLDCSQWKWVALALLSWCRDGLSAVIPSFVPGAVGLLNLCDPPPALSDICGKDRSLLSSSLILPSFKAFCTFATLLSLEKCSKDICILTSCPFSPDNEEKQALLESRSSVLLPNLGSGPSRMLCPFLSGDRPY